jgi:hypothetical protein
MAEIEAREKVAMAKAIEQRGARDIAKRALQTTGKSFATASPTGMQNATRLPTSAPATF